MKHFIILILLGFTLSCMGQISYNPARKLIYVRTCTVAHKKPPISQLSEGIWGYNSADSIVYKGVNGYVVAFARMFNYTNGVKKVVHASTIGTTTYNFSSLRKMYYVLYDYIAGNMPVLADFPTSIYQCINLHDSLWYDKYNGLVHKAKVFFPYSEYKSNEVIPDLITRIYVSPIGSDSSVNPHSTSTPYRTLYHACLVATSGDTIRLLSGMFIETHNCNLAVGVSIEGEGTNTIIQGTYTTSASYDPYLATITLSSASKGTNGNQSISNLVMDGNLTGSRAIGVKNRSNVSVHDCTIHNFFIGGISMFNSGIYIDAVPSVYEMDNSIYNCNITSCGDAAGTLSGGGLILLACQDGISVHDCVLHSDTKAVGHNGNIINAGGRHFKNMKYYNNISYKPDWDGTDVSGGTYDGRPTGWNFHLEFWQVDDGLEIYNNEFHGGENPIDIGGHKLPYSTGISIHDNLFQPISGNGFSGGTTHSRLAIVIEEYFTDGVVIYNNHFVGWQACISVGDAPSTLCDIKNVSIYNNLMEDVGADGAGYYNGVIMIQVERVGNNLSNINIYNNTIVSDNLVNCNALSIAIGKKSGNTPVAGGTLTNLNFKNNIMMYFKNKGPIQITNCGAIIGLHIENNLAYNAANYNILPYNWPYANGTMTNYTYLNNIPVSNITQQLPQFVSSSDFHLQSGSPAINAGVDVGLPYLGIAPDIGAFEKQ